MVFRSTRQVSSTTWPQRHAGTFRELANWLRRLNVSRPTVLEIGPGATSVLLARHLAAGEGESLSWLANRYRAMLRKVDGILRRLPHTVLQSYEPGELLAALPEGTTLIVTDISQRVIDAIRAQYPHLRAAVFDFSAQSYAEPLDVIVSLCVLVRTDAPQQIFTNLYHSLKPGGLLVMDHRSFRQFAPPDLPMRQLASQIWQKVR